MKKLLFSFVVLVVFTIELRSQSPIDLAESTLKIGELSEEEFYFGFTEGDQIVFNFKELKGKALKEVEIVELPS